MRLLHIISSLDPAQGGPPVVVSRLGAAQHALGHDVSVLGYARGDAKSRIHSMFSDVPEAGPRQVHLLEPGSRIEQLRARRARRWLQEHLDGFDLLHLHGVWDPILSTAVRLATNHTVPWIITPHGMLDPWCMSQGRFKKHVAIRTWVRPILQHARFIHALNEDECSGMASLVNSTPMEVIPNGVFLEELAKPESMRAFRSEHRELGEDPYILFLSRLHYKKGLDVLVESFARTLKQCRTARLVIAGPDDGYESTLRALIEHSPARDRVHLVGPLYGEAKRAAICEAECFCLPSRQEGFSMAITEALGFGTPVVITKACHFPEVGDAGAGHVVDLDAQAVATALIDVLQKPDLRQTMGRAGTELVRTRYTWPAIARRFDALFQEYNCS